MNGWTLTKVFEVNGKLVVADTIEQAIGLYQLRGDVDIRNVKQVYGGLNNYDALIAEPVSCSCHGWNLTHITFTGVDEWTDIDRLVDIQHRYPKAEFGVLMSRNWQKNGNRFPSPAVIENLYGRGLRLSAHLCGSLATGFLYDCAFSSLEQPFWNILHNLEMFQRIQLNVSGCKEKPEYDIAPYPMEEVIIQQGDDLNLFEQLYITSGDHIAILLDKSGGRGVDTPIEAPAYASKVHLGFAGGINPDNVIDKMNEITSLPVGRFWIDMESGVRTDDRFDLDKVETVCKKVYDNFLSVNS